MRIAYYNDWSEGLASGVFKKIVAQTKQWVEHGATVAIFNLSTSETSTEWKEALDDRVYFEQTLAKSFRHQQIVIPRVVKRILSWDPDIVYFRNAIFHPAFAYLNRNCRVVLEVNSDDVEEAKHATRKYYWYHRLTRNWSLNSAHGIVFVSHEVSNNKHFRHVNPKIEVIPNGIDLSLYSPLPPASNTVPRLVFMGSPGRIWHGTDKIIWLATQMREWHFDLIGISNDELHNAPSNVTLRGTMTASKYTEVISSADVAISSLALHRINVGEISPLKTLEYLAYGIPVITGYKDSNFMNGANFLLCLPNTEDNVSSNINVIKCFVEQIKGTRVKSTDILHIDSGVKEKQRLQFFRTILEYPAR